MSLSLVDLARSLLADGLTSSALVAASLAIGHANNTSNSSNAGERPGGSDDKTEALIVFGDILMESLEPRRATEYYEHALQRIRSLLRDIPGAQMKEPPAMSEYEVELCLKYGKAAVAAQDYDRACSALESIPKIARSVAVLRLLATAYEARGETR
ncbi:hypothetical protein HK405_008155 [Cladochytrium tenue]|nr:hypothetical protein HK405_008155 [Cladochytrium tenue]